MLEGILLTVVLGYVFSYIALKIIYWLFDRPATPKQREEWRKKIDDDHQRWLSSPEFQKLNQERLNRLRCEQQPERTESLPLYSAK